MTKLALIFIAVFLFVQFATAADVEATTPNLLDQLKTGIENTFSEDNMKKILGNLNEFGEKAKEVGNKLATNFQNALKSEDKGAVPAQ